MQEGKTYMNKDLDADLHTVNETSLEENNLKGKEAVNELMSYRSSKVAFNETSNINLQLSGN
jgi:hypothetical protein